MAKYPTWLAAGVMLAVLAGTYHLALLQPGSLAPAGQPSTRAAAAALVPNSLREPVPNAAAAPAPPAAEPPDAPCRPQPRQFGLVGRRRLLRRYVGTVGGEPATALLEWQNPDSVSGTFYLHRRGPAYSLGSLPSRGGQLVLGVGNDYNYQAGTGEWHLSGRLGAVLRGTWRDTTGSHPLVLRERYAGAVQAEVRTLWLRGGKARTQRKQTCSVPSYTLDYLFLPAPLAVAPALRRRLALPLATRYRQMQHELTENDERTTTIYRLQINDFQLLGYQITHHGRYFADEHGGDWTDSFLFDLVSGRALDLGSQLRPDCDLPLQRLLRQHLLHDSNFDAVNKSHSETWRWEGVTDRAGPLPGLPNPITANSTQGLFLTGGGLEAHYPASQLYELDFTESLYRGDLIVLIPYAELRPLVQSGTPLARMLQARGLW